MGVEYRDQYGNKLGSIEDSSSDKHVIRDAQGNTIGEIKVHSPRSGGNRFNRKLLVPILIAVCVILCIAIIAATLSGRNSNSPNKSSNTHNSLPSYAQNSQPASTPKPASTPAQPALRLSKFEGTLASYTKVRFDDASASSEYVQGDIVFKASYAIDSGSNRPWVEGKSGSGTGETLTLYFDGTKTIDVLSLRLGYARSDDYFYKNNRPSKLRFTFSDGSSVEYSFSDANKVNNIQLSESVTTNYVKITILDVYSGTDNDTCIYLVEAYRK